MITISDINKFNGTIELYGLSTDTKPVRKFEYKGTEYAITNSSVFYAMDTKIAYLYDEQNHTWLEQ